MTSVVLNTVTRKLEVFSSARDVQARAEIANHKAAANPHPQYLAGAEAADIALSGDAGDLTAGTVPDARMPGWTGYNLASRAALEAATVPAAVVELRLLGDAAVGDGGGAQYKRVALEPIHPHKIQSADGAWWEELFAVDVTVNIPSDFATLQAAIDRLSKQPVRHGARILLNIESGHALTAGLSVSDGDYSRFTITSDDPEVTLDAAWPAGTSVALGDNCRMPNWGILVDCGSRDTGKRGLSVINNSSLSILDGCGLKNTGGTAEGTGLFVYRNSRVSGFETVFTGCAGTNVQITHASTAWLEKGNFSGGEVTDSQGHGNVFVSRASTLYAAGSNFNNALNGNGLKIRRSLAVVIPTGGTNTTFDGNFIGILAENSARIIACQRGSDTVVLSSGTHAVEIDEGSFLDMRGAEVSTMSADGIRAFAGATVVADGATMTGIGRYAVHCNGALVYAQSLSAPSAGNVGLWATKGGKIVAADADVNGAGTVDVNVSASGTIVLGGSATYTTTSQTENIVTGDGVILSSAADDMSYHRENILGTVSQSGGTPTGSAIERGSNAFGEYVRFADGTQICTRSVSHDLSTSLAQSWSFAATFAAIPAASHGVVGSASTDAQDWHTRNGVAWAGSVNAWQTRAPAGSSIAKSVTLQLTAIGRWF